MNVDFMTVKKHVLFNGTVKTCVLCVSIIRIFYLRFGALRSHDVKAIEEM